MVVERLTAGECQSASMASAPSQRAQGRASLLRHVLHWLLALAASVLLFIGYAYLELNGHTMAAYACLAGSALLVLNPLKALVHRVFGIERGILHLAQLLPGWG